MSHCRLRCNTNRWLYANGKAQSDARQLQPTSMTRSVAALGHHALFTTWQFLIEKIKGFSVTWHHFSANCRQYFQVRNIARTKVAWDKMLTHSNSLFVCVPCTAYFFLWLSQRARSILTTVSSIVTVPVSCRLSDASPARRWREGARRSSTCGMEQRKRRTPPSSS